MVNPTEIASQFLVLRLLEMMTNGGGIGTGSYGHPASKKALYPFYTFMFVGGTDQPRRGNGGITYCWSPVYLVTIQARDDQIDRRTCEQEGTYILRYCCTTPDAQAPGPVEILDSGGGSYFVTCSPDSRGMFEQHELKDAVSLTRSGPFLRLFIVPGQEN